MKSKPKIQYQQQTSFSDVQGVELQNTPQIYYEVPSSQNGPTSSKDDIQISTTTSAKTNPSLNKTQKNKVRHKKMKFFITSVILGTIVALALLWNMFGPAKGILFFWGIVDQQDIDNQYWLNQDSRLFSLTYANDKYQSVIKRRFNPENNGKVFGFQKQFGVDISSIKVEQQYIKTLKQLDLYQKIQVGSVHDYANLTKSVNFTKLASRLSKTIAYEQYTFAYDKNIQQQKRPQILQINNKFKDDGISDEQKYKDLGLDTKNQFFELYLGALITRNPLASEVKQAQYYHYDTKYQLSKEKQQRPICVYASGYKVFSKNRHIQFFTTLQRQNYTNFHIVYVDDNSPSQQTQNLVKYLQQQKYRLNNRIKIIHTTQHLGALANMYFFINKHCKSDDIVINIDADDALIGHQALKVINRVYQDTEVWFAYSRYILAKDMERRNLQIGFSAKMRVTPEIYRNQYGFWDVSHLRTFRKKLFQKIPIYMMMQYHVNHSTGMAYPYFYSFAADTFQIFTLLQMTGQKNYKYITDFLYLYYGTASSPGKKNCYPKHQKFDDFKSRIKTPVKKLKSLKDQVRQVENFSLPLSTWETFKIVQKEYMNCLKQ